MYDLFWVGPALVTGLLAVRFGLPPLVGYLIAGFVLNALGVGDYAKLSAIGELGVTLLLFTIGLKLDVRALLRPVIWAGTTLHMLVTVAVFGTTIYWLGLTGLAIFSDIDYRVALLIGFALSFSSTVFAVKALEEKGEYTSGYGQLAIGVLIMQDIIAVVFLAASTGKLPSPWALALFLLIPLRGVLMEVLNRVGHSELQILYGIALAFGGWSLFDVLDVKGDLGALLVGALLASHPAAGELSKKLLGFKELLLVGFFLTIGLSGVPTLAAVGVAALLVIVVPLKGALFYLLLTRFRLRARSSLLASLSLANYSEFGLIVAAVGASQGWIGPEWLVIIALALSATFVIGSPLNTAADALYVRYRDRLSRFETDTRHPDDQPIDSGDATIGVFGMGRIGTMAYDFMREKYGEKVMGFDFNAEKVRMHCEAGRKVVFGDPTDPDFWPRIKRQRGKARMALLTMPKHQANLASTRHLVEVGFPGTIAAIAHFDDQVDELKEAGAKATFNFYNEAGLGFAEHAWKALEGQHDPEEAS